MNRFRSRIAYVFLALVLVTGLVGVAGSRAEAATTLEIPDSTISVGQTASVPVTLKDAPTGVSGYSLVVVTLNSNVAEITDVTLPDLGLSRIEFISSSEVHFAAVDFNRLIESGASDINLATLQIKGLKRGSTDVTVRAVRLDDDFGNPIDTEVVSGTLTVKKGRGGGDGGTGGGKGKGRGNGKNK